MEKKEKHGLKYWVKKIFSIQFLSLLVAIAGVLFAYYQFVYNKTPKLTIELDMHKSDDGIVRKNVDDIHNFYGVFFYDIPLADLGYTTYLPEGIQIPYVHILNKGKKAITNLFCDIRVVYDNDFDSEMIAFNTSKFQIEHNHLKYTENKLNACSAIPIPINELLLFSPN